MIFISERITNISKLEELIGYAKFNFEVLMDEIAKAEPSAETIDSAAFAVKSSLHKASEFEFLIEKRKCEFKDFPESQKS